MSSSDHTWSYLFFVNVTEDRTLNWKAKGCALPWSIWVILGESLHHIRLCDPMCNIRKWNFYLPVFKEPTFWFSLLILDSKDLLKDIVIILPLFHSTLSWVTGPNPPACLYYSQLKPSDPVFLQAEFLRDSPKQWNQQVQCLRQYRSTTLFENPTDLSREKRRGRSAVPRNLIKCAGFYSSFCT